MVLSVLTERGAAVVAERQAQMEPRWRAALAEFSDAELAAAARVLNRLADYFDALERRQRQRLNRAGRQAVRGGAAVAAP